MHVAVDAVADGVNVGVARPQVIVYLNACSRIKRDTGVFEAHASHVRLPARCDQQNIARENNCVTATRACAEINSHKRGSGTVRRRRAVKF